MTRQKWCIVQLREDPRLKNVYVFWGAFEKEKSIIPVELLVKEFDEKTSLDNKLYISINMSEIKRNLVIGTKQEVKNLSVDTNEVPTYTLYDLIKNVNPNDYSFLKYLPEEILSEEQIT